MFNDDQRAHMRYLATVPPTARCWSGWCERAKDGTWKFCSSPRPCPVDVTLADRLRQACETCGNFPDPVTGRMSHNVACSPELRRDFYASVDLGEAGA